MIALDTSAVIAFLKGEAGQEVVRNHLAAACMSTVSLAEALGRLARDGILPASASAQFQGTGLELVPFDTVQAEIAGALIMPARKLNVGLGDCCSIALAVARNCPVLTADRDWTGLALPIQVLLIR